MPRLTQTQVAQAFAALHQTPGGFILPNAWDAGSAIILAQAGFPAVATTSAGIAFSMGKQDYQVSDPGLAVSRAEMFARIGEIVRAVDTPVNGDLEAGWGPAPEDVVETIEMAIEIGLAGGNIEDKDPDGADLYDEAHAVARIAAAARAIRGRGATFVLNARTDLLQSGGREALAACIRRANLFLAAGADCVFTPGAPDLATIATLAREIDGPLNIVVGLPGTPTDVRRVLAAGAQRVTVGGSIARSALAFVRRCTEELRDQGTLGFADQQLSQPELNRLFARARGGVDGERKD